MQLTFFVHFKLLQLLLFYLLSSFLVTFIICFSYKTTVLFCWTKFFIQLQKKFIFTKLTTGFWVYIKISVLMASIFVIPVIIYFLCFFLLKSFYRYQLKLFIFFIPLIVGILFYFFNFFFLIIFPKIILFFLSFEDYGPSLQVILEARVDEYLIFFINFLLWIVFILLTPAIFVILKIFKYFKDWNTIRQYTYSFFLIFFFLFAPPDVSLQILVFWPLIFFIELFLFLFYILEIFLVKFTEESRIRTYDEN